MDTGFESQLGRMCDRGCAYCPSLELSKPLEGLDCNHLNQSFIFHLTCYRHHMQKAQGVKIPIEQFGGQPFQRGDRHQTSDSDVCRRYILTSQVDERMQVFYWP